LMHASAFNCRRVTTVRKSGRGRLERGNLHGRVGRRGKKRGADLAWRRREDLRLSCVGSPRNDKDPHQRSSQKEHAVCLHAAQIYDRSKRNVDMVWTVVFVDKTRRLSRLCCAPILQHARPCPHTLCNGGGLSCLFGSAAGRPKRVRSRRLGSSTMSTCAVTATSRHSPARRMPMRITPASLWT